MTRAAQQLDKNGQPLFLGGCLSIFRHVLAHRLCLIAELRYQLCTVILEDLDRKLRTTLIASKPYAAVSTHAKDAYLSTKPVNACSKVTAAVLNLPSPVLPICNGASEPKDECPCASFSRAVGSSPSDRRQSLGGGKGLTSGGLTAPGKHTSLGTPNYKRNRVGGFDDDLSSTAFVARNRGTLRRTHQGTTRRIL